MSERRSSSLLPWAGLFLGLPAWFAGQQVSSYLVPWNCRLGHTLPALIIGLVSLVLAGAGIILSWREWHSTAKTDVESGLGTRRFIAKMSAGIGAVFLVAILLQTAAGFVFTGCEQ